MANGPGMSIWAMIDVVLLVILGAAMVYGAIMWSRARKDPAIREAQDRGTERVYQQAERRDREEIGQ
jgi:hypothetical protein